MGLRFNKLHIYIGRKGHVDGKAYFITFCEATDFVKKLLNNCLKAYDSQV